MGTNLLKTATLCAVMSVMTLAAAGTAWAHVEVSPTEVSPGGTEEFTVDVAGEKSVPAVEVRLEVPEGFEVTDVGAASGWQGELRDGSIVWSGGKLAEDRAVQFTFEARAPEEGGESVWNGFVTYDDGDVIEWNGAPGSERPASVVTVGSGGAQTSGSGLPEGAQVPETGGMSPALVLAGVLALVAGLALRHRVRA